jgi:hypothetical protein
VRRAPRRDINERAIIDHLEAAGCVVQQLSAKGVADLLVFRASNGLLRLIEVKQPKGKLTEAQRLAFPRWPGWVCRTPEQALAAMSVEVAR